MRIYRFKPRVLLKLADLVFTFVEFVISVRLLLRFLGANAAAPFVRWIYETSDPFLAPFQGIFPNPRLNGPFVLEASALFALLTYLFAAYLVEEAIGIFSPAGQEEVSSGEVREEHLAKGTERTSQVTSVSKA